MSKKTPELRLLLSDLLRPARVAEPAERVVRRARRDRVRLAAGRLDVGERLLPALLEADPELGLHEPHVCAQDPAEQDVPDAVVDGVGPVDPALLDEHALQPRARRDRRDLARVIRLHAADRDERVAALFERVGEQVLEFPRLVASVGEARADVVALRPHARAAEVLGQPLERMDRRGAEEKRIALELVEAHGATVCRVVRASHLPSAVPGVR